MLDEENYPNIPKEDRWLYNKLAIAEKQDLVCGLREIPVPKHQHYIIRPIYNLSGLGLGATKEYLTPNLTEQLVPKGYFWVEELYGKHISVDYTNGKPTLTVEGIKKQYTLKYWDKWVKISNSKAPKPPEWLIPYLEKYTTVNVEYIGSNIVEVHLNRGNPDFEGHSYKELIPVYDKLEELEGYTFIPSPEKEVGRLGFLAK